MTAASSRPIYHIYRGRGDHVDRVVASAVPGRDDEDMYVPTIADLVPVTEIMTRDVTCARRDLRVEVLAQLIVRDHIGCIPIVEAAGRPIGMVTKLDLVEQLLALDEVATAKDSPCCCGLAPRIAADLMMGIAITLGERASVAHAAALMATEDIHHIPIVDDDGQLVGIVSSMDVVRWLAANDGFLSHRRTSSPSEPQGDGGTRDASSRKQEEG